MGRGKLKLEYYVLLVGHDIQNVHCIKVFSGYTASSTLMATCVTLTDLSQNCDISVTGTAEKLLFKNPPKSLFIFPLDVSRYSRAFCDIMCLNTCSSPGLLKIFRILKLGEGFMTSWLNYICFNFSERVHGKKTFVNICLHNVTDYGNIDPSGIKILVKEAGCSGTHFH